MVANARPIFRLITYFDAPAAVACDARCEKAWGNNNRPQIQFSDDEEDTAFLADDEVGIAPENPGTYEGECAKPRTPEERLNKWCVRECERSEMTDAPHTYAGKRCPLETVSDFSERRYNQPWKHEADAREVEQLRRKLRAVAKEEQSDRRDWNYVNRLADEREKLEQRLRELSGRRVR